MRTIENAPREQVLENLGFCVDHQLVRFERDLLTSMRCILKFADFEKGSENTSVYAMDVLKAIGCIDTEYLKSFI